MKQTDLTCAAFSAALASLAPSPGGGGAAALCGSLACALGRMVSALSENKKSCAEHREEIAAIANRLEALRLDLLALVDEDEAGFLPLSAAWGMDKSDPNREEAIEAALNAACEAPEKMMEALCEGAELLSDLAPICSPIMISDAGAGAAVCAGALRAAALNVYVNAGLMKQRDRAGELVRRTDALLESALLADETFRFVQQKLKKD